MDYCTLNKEKGVANTFKKQSCFLALSIYKNKSEIEFIQYLPKKGNHEDKPLNEKEKLNFLSKIKELPFFIYENEDVEDILKGGVIVSASLPPANMIAILSIVRYIEEKPYRIRSFLELINDGFSVHTALAFCHLLKENKTPFVYTSNHDLLENKHFGYINCIKNYPHYLYENVKNSTPFNKEKEYIRFGLWDLITKLGAIGKSDYETNNISTWSVDKIMKYARSIDK